jgi:hypothetical protein
MKSKLAEDARRALLADTRRMTAEQRLAAYAMHCQLMARLRIAGATARFGRDAARPVARLLADSIDDREVP